MNLEITNPFALGIIECDNGLKEESWAEKRRNELIWKIKKRIAFFNILCSIGITCIVTFLLFFCIYKIDYVRQIDDLTSIIFGVLAAELILLSALISRAIFEPNPSFIKIKRNGGWI